MVDWDKARPLDQKKQNILPAVSDDLMNRIKALQALYLVDGKPSTVEQVLDRALSVWQQEMDGVDFDLPH